MGKEIVHRFFYGVLITLAGLLFTAGPSFALSVDQVRFGIHPDKIRMVVELSKEAEYRAFTLSDPYRVVIDLPQVEWQAGEISKPAGSGVLAIRQGVLQEGVSRLVIETSKPVIIHAAFFLKAEKGNPNKLVIDFKEVSESRFLEDKGKVYGKMEVSDVHSKGTNYSDPQNDVTVMAAKHPAAVPVPALPARKNIEKVSAGHQAGNIVVPPRRPSSITYEKPMIIIDAGHGGKDPGAHSHNGIYEKHITLAMAKELKKTLESTGRYRVRLTRANDTYLRLYKRVEYARKNDGDLFISLHADSIEKTGVRGASIYTLSEKASDKQTERLAAKENSVDLIGGIDLSSEDPDVANILISLAMRDTMNQSKFFANKIVDHFGQHNIRILEKPHRYAGFAVLKAPDIPSVLIEMGFMSNAQEARLLSSPSYRAQITEALVDGIDSYFEKRRHDRSY